MAVAVAFSWIVNAALLVTAFGWIYYFGQSRGTIEWMNYRVTLGHSSPAIVARDVPRLGSGVTVGIRKFVCWRGTIPYDADVAGVYGDYMRLARADS
jgi:hypothetical protein